MDKIKEKINWLHVYVGFFIGFGIGMILFVIISNIEYKNGQVDAINGQIKYELVNHPDSTKTWERIKK